MDDVVGMLRALIACPSVTPAEGGAQLLLADWLEALGFEVAQVPFNGISNLWARLGTGAPHFCFAGHTDVVPAGDAAWQHPPFAGTLTDGVIYGRGAVDMKGAIAAFVAATARVLAEGTPRGSISLLITGDEEGAAVDGTVRVLEWLRARGEIPDMCLVGEPTNPGILGEVIKIGRRGSLNAEITVPGIQGHVAYPHLADNPVHRLVRLLAALISHQLDAGTEWFAPSSLQITSVDVGNPATNIIPGTARARLNIRFNDCHTGASLTAWLEAMAAEYAAGARVAVTVSGEAFRTAEAEFTRMLASVVARTTGVTPRMDTGGGTSDARFIARYCPVAEFGLVGASMHKADEHTPVADLHRLVDVYADVLRAVVA